jgi:hypothetical protein
VSVLVVAQSISEVPEGLMNNPVYSGDQIFCDVCNKVFINKRSLLEQSCYN